MSQDVGRLTYDLPRLEDVALLTWSVAGVDRQAVLRSGVLSDGRLVELWSAARHLSQAWLVRLSNLGDPAGLDTSAPRFHEFRQLASEILVADQLLRVLATVLACSDVVPADRALANGNQCPERDAPREPARPILDRVVDYVGYARECVLEAMLRMAESAAPIDRLRRRCERWTDLLIGPWLVRHGIAAYAHDPRRSWDYGEDAVGDQPPARRLLQLSYATAFHDEMLESGVEGPDWLVLYQQSQALIGDVNPPEAAPVQPAAVADSPTCGEDATLLTKPAPERVPESSGTILERCLRVLRDR